MKSPNYLYCNAINPRLKVLLRNYTLSDDIAFRFSDRSWASYPLTADKYASWLKGLAPASELVNIFMDYETFGEHQKKETGIFEFLKNLPDMIIKKTPFSFMTVSEVADHYQPVSLLHVPSPISWADEERDLTAWMGNELQTAAVNKLYSMSDRVGRCDNEQLMRDWVYLQSSDHFYYMSTKFFSDGAVHAYFNPYENPYQAFMNYMNVLSDFEIRLKSVCPVTDHDEEVNCLSADIQRRDRMIAELQEKLARLERKPAARKRAGVAVAAAAKKPACCETAAPAPKGVAAKKPAAVSTKVAAPQRKLSSRRPPRRSCRAEDRRKKPAAAKQPAPAPRGVAAKKPAAVSTKAATPVKATKAKKKVEADVKKPAATRAGSVRKKAGGK
jgi:alpha-amylase